MRCIKGTKDGAELLLDFCSGKLEPGQRAEFERHIAGCAECREQVDAQRLVWETMERWTPPAVSPEFNARLYERIAADASGWRKWLPGILRPAVPLSIGKSAALATACAVLMAAFLMRAPHSHETASQPDTEKVDIEQVANTLEELDMLTPAPTPAGEM
jgi:anti-sigma factor RsiW